MCGYILYHRNLPNAHRTKLNVLKMVRMRAVMWKIFVTSTKLIQIWKYVSRNSSLASKLNTTLTIPEWVSTSIWEWRTRYCRTWFTGIPSISNVSAVCLCKLVPKQMFHEYLSFSHISHKEVSFRITSHNLQQTKNN